MTVITLDRALRKLLDKLPSGNPDASPEMFEVWIGFCRKRCVVRANEPTHCDFGEWWGPPMRVCEIIVHGKSLETGLEGWATFPETAVIQSGWNLCGEVVVIPK